MLLDTDVTELINDVDDLSEGVIKEGSFLCFFCHFLSVEDDCEIFFVLSL